MARAWAWLILAALAAGCIGPGDDPPTVPAPTPTPTVAPGPDLSVPAKPSDALADLTEFHWALQEAPDPLVLHVVFDIGSNNTCDLQTALPYEGASVAFREGPDYAVFSTYGMDGGSGAFPLDGWNPTHISLTLLGRGLEGTPSYHGGAAIAFDLVCDLPFDIVSAREGSDLLLAAGADLDGTGLHNEVVDLARGQTATFTSASPDVRAVGHGFGDQAARVLLAAPDGEHEWLFVKDPPLAGILPEVPGFYSVEAGPGTYGFTVDQAAANFKSLHLAAWGVDRPADLQVGRLDASAIDWTA